MSDAPRLSVVVVDSGPGPLRPAFFDALAAGLVEGTLEVVWVAVSDPPAELVERYGPRVIRRDPGTTVPRLRAAGLRAARAPLVALTESFCVPALGWAEAIQRAHDERDVAAVGGPVGRRAGGAVNWALTLCEYGRFLGREPAAAVDHLPGINVAYKIERLRRALGTLPEEILEVDLHRRLVQGGETLWRHPDVLMCDESSLSLAAATRSQYHHGRLFGGRRLQGRALPARLLRFALSPAVPVVQGWRIARQARAAGRGGQLLRASPALLVLLLSWTLGEATGSLLGEGGSGGRWT